jgi:hypothetical protein
VSANANMFFNLVKTVEATSPAPGHVYLSQGTRCSFGCSRIFGATGSFRDGATSRVRRVKKVVTTL